MPKKVRKRLTNRKWYNRILAAKREARRLAPATGDVVIEEVFAGNDKGANSHGQLAQGSVSEACLIPREILDPLFDPVNIKSIVGGGGHTLLLLRNGQVFGSGWNNAKQLGIEHEESILSFSLIENLSHHHVDYLACSWDSSLATSRDGSLLVWGSNSFSQLGFARDSMSWTSKPTLLPFTAPKHAAFGLRHLVIVDSNGNVFVCGSGNKGQLGLIDSEGMPIREVPSLTRGIEGVIRAACGQHHTVVLTSSGHVLTWGHNRYGQLGLDPTLHPIVPTPRQLDTCSDVRDIFAGWTFTVTISDGGVLTAWGRNNYGQVGVRCNVTHRPVPLSSLPRVKQLSVGSEHSLAMLEMGCLVSWGWNEHGNCGNGSVENVLEPTPVCLQNGKAVLIGGGACHNFAVVDA